MQLIIGRSKGIVLFMSMIVMSAAPSAATPQHRSVELAGREPLRREPARSQMSPTQQMRRRCTATAADASGMTRRQLVVRIAAAGGGSLAYEAMTALGLLAAPSQTPFSLAGRVSGVRVVVLGAGVSGLTAAYELGKVG